MNLNRSDNIYRQVNDSVFEPAHISVRSGTGGRRSESMTNLGDVVRQVETAMCDTYYPPTSNEREIYNRILLTVFTGAVDAKGSK